MGVSTQDDGTLVRSIAGGGAFDAEAELCRRMGPRARLYGLRHLRDGQRAADLAQSALVTLLVAARAGRVDEPDHIDRYMLGTCRNLARRMRESDARTEPVDPAEIDLGSVLPPLERIDSRALSDCLSRLTERAFMIVMLSFQAGAPASEIATRLGTTPTNVRVMRHRALEQLRRCIDGDEESVS